MLALITATRNSDRTLPSALASASRIDRPFKHIFVDGSSRDNTLRQIDEYAATKANVVVLNQLDAGLYQALNQGLRVAIDDSRVTHVGLLHSDDLLIAETYCSYLGKAMRSGADVCYSNIEFRDESGNRVRRWNSSEFTLFKLRTGWMPPHTSLIVRKDVYVSSGLFNTGYGTAADYEWIVRVFKNADYRFKFFPLCTLVMLVGGASGESLTTRLLANRNDGKAWAGHSRLQIGIIRVCKPMRKLGQFIAT